MSTKTKEKFTAVLTHASDKNRIVEIREAAGLSEKDTMTAILDAAMPFRDKIIEAAKKLVEAKVASRETLRLQKYEDFKAEQKAVRAAIKAKREASPAPETPAAPLGEAQSIQPPTSANKNKKGVQV